MTDKQTALPLAHVCGVIILRRSSDSSYDSTD